MSRDDDDVDDDLTKYKFLKKSIFSHFKMM